MARVSAFFFSGRLSRMERSPASSVISISDMIFLKGRLGHAHPPRGYRQARHPMA
jgi:hypothetical protein